MENSGALMGNARNQQVQASSCDLGWSIDRAQTSRAYSAHANVDLLTLV